jgi:DNA-binding MarR family transcriptional regulator/N-acetylglutamate synthase-like GNAT family acetyltransferase
MDEVGQVRQFNRTVTQHIGVLEQDFLGRKRPIAASRLLFEIGQAGLAVRDLRARLGLDSGYTSRLLRLLEQEGLIEVLKAQDDARVRALALTQAGLAELATLNQRSDQAALALLEPLSAPQKTRLVESMNTVERLLQASATRIGLHNPSSRLAEQCLSAYYQELASRLSAGFDPSRSISASAEELMPPNGAFLVAELHGQAVGCGGLKYQGNIGEIKRMWVAASLRGLGLGKRILAELEQLARQQQLRVLRLETNQALLEAQHLYLSFGYLEVAAFSHEPYADYWFEKQLV